MDLAREWQFDGLVGPTHNYAGLAFGNVAAAHNAGQVSNPRQAALQGLEKMRFVRDLGIPQSFLPPHPRPAVSVLQRIGFTGDTKVVLEAAGRVDPALLAAVFSSSFMWVANAATVSPSSDTADGRLHLGVANLTSHFHRSIEAEFTRRLLHSIFHNADGFSVDNYLPASPEMSDEGAANHMLIKGNDGDFALHAFVYGGDGKKSLSSVRFPARQQRMASEAVARLLGLAPEACLYLQQDPAAIDAGVFHNDVIAMNSGRLMIAHAQAYIPQDRAVLRGLGERVKGFIYREVSPEMLTLEEAVSTYLFNSQLCALSDGKFVLVAPLECANHPRAKALLDGWLAEGTLSQVHYLDVRESMRNGGGPACLRLRVMMTGAEAAAIHPGVILTDAKYHALKQWINAHYRDRLSVDDFRDPLFLDELAAAYAALEGIVGIPGLYSGYTA
jgi:succinylarginine dihydrolase